MRQFLVLLVELSPLVLLLCQLSLCLVKLFNNLSQFILVLFILRLDVLHLLTSVGKHDHMVDDLASEAGQLLVSLLNLLIKRLILNLELLVIDQVEAFSKLLFLLQYFLLVGKTISKCDVLQSILMNFLIFGFIGLFPILDGLGAQFLTSAAMHGVHGH